MFCTQEGIKYTRAVSHSLGVFKCWSSENILKCKPISVDVPKAAFCFYVVSQMKHFSSSSVDTARSYHEQLQEDEKRRDDEAEPQVFGLLLLGQLLAQQNFTHQLQAEHR